MVDLFIFIQLYIRCSMYVKYVSSMYNSIAVYIYTAIHTL